MGVVSNWSVSPSQVDVSVLVVLPIREWGDERRGGEATFQLLTLCPGPSWFGEFLVRVTYFLFVLVR